MLQDDMIGGLERERNGLLHSLSVSPRRVYTHLFPSRRTMREPSSYGRRKTTGVTPCLANLRRAGLGISYNRYLLLLCVCVCVCVCWGGQSRVRRGIVSKIAREEPSRETAESGRKPKKVWQHHQQFKPCLCSRPCA